MKAAGKDKISDVLNTNQETTFVISQHPLTKGGPGTGLSIAFGIAAFDDNSVLLVGVTEGTWGDDSFGGFDFAVTKLSESGDMEWSWQVIIGAFPNTNLGQPSLPSRIKCIARSVFETL